jgi:B12 binding domain
MKIMLTHGYFIEEDKKEQAIMRPYVPLGILYISAFLEQRGYDNEVFDSTFSSFERLCSALLEMRPLVLGIYTNLMTKLNVLRIMRFVRGCPELAQTRIVLGGPEVRNHIVKFMDAGADYIVLGEGEQTMLELVRFAIPFHLVPGHIEFLFDGHEGCGPKGFPGIYRDGILGAHALVPCEFLGYYDIAIITQRIKMTDHAIRIGRGQGDRVRSF